MPYIVTKFTFLSLRNRDFIYFVVECRPFIFRIKNYVFT
ncbi:hypothetical protein NTHI1209_02089 [Haemophilus influenzae]|uniref:Uncharacterized protein n=1 Tax=Haemophilus influenzae TaxID=727 RepID=A0A158SZZ5_HAEIF|nr:hypothetical protein NTHI1209_02089 [Haemophilus influenzae]